LWYFEAMKKLILLYFSIITCLFSPDYALAQDTVKIMSYNVLNLNTDTSRNGYFRTVLQNSNPDILVAEEIISQSAVNNIRDKILNLLGFGTFGAGVFIDGFDTDNAVFFKTSKFAFISNTPIHTELRDINEFKLVHLSTFDTLRIYALHLKAGNTSPDIQQRGREVDSLRKVTNTLAINSNFIVCGDFNIYSSNEIAYTKLLQVVSGNQGHFYDMLNLTGTWNNSAYSMYHTQSPRVRQFGGGATGGMDDRFDMILYSSAINVDGGVSIIPGSLVAYGNDGQHFNDSINRPPNIAVGQVIADALHYASDHIPVFALFKFQSPIGIQPVSSFIPEVFMLNQNYPNPFNPSTKIRFSISESGYTKLSVHDVTGREIAVPFKEHLGRGEYEIIFDASKLPSGIYLYRIISGDFIETKKMILIK
jgi:Secretion system C-terminal sorting domain